MNRNVLAVCTHRWLGIVWVGLLAAILTVAIGCGGDDGLGDCPPASQSQQNTGATIVFTTCIGCHSSQLQGADRRGVPDGMDFDVIDVAPRRVRYSCEGCSLAGDCKNHALCRYTFNKCRLCKTVSDREHS